ncbi:MAG: gamma carbonic anhydrase family protein [Planctomycetes bacterium]|nr:gamma carbonic anhydrase family protein [Planctomycetota bacterium]
MTFFPRAGLMIALPGGAFRAADARLTGELELGPDASVWFGCVLRGDDAPIRIGARTNIQDLTMVHADPGVPNVIGDGVTIGHRCVLHGASIGSGALIGMGAVLLGGSVIGAQALVAAGAVVREGFHVPPRTLVAGVPAKVIRPLSEAELAALEASAEGYVRKTRLYL